MLREILSINTQRYKKEGFNLDFTYITDKIVAMALPGEGFQKLYKNPIKQVSKLLNQHHGDKYLVVNCGAYQYDRNLFNDNIIDVQWKDHFPPLFSNLLKSVLEIGIYMLKNPDHVIAIHCYAGKGRTGSLTCCILLMSNVFGGIKSCNEFYKLKRKVNVTRVDQLRYVDYFQKFFNFNKQMNCQILILKKIVIQYKNVKQKKYEFKMKFYDLIDLKKIKKVNKKNNKFQESQTDGNCQIAFDVEEWDFPDLRDVRMKLKINVKSGFCTFNLFFAENNEIVIHGDQFDNLTYKDKDLLIKLQFEAKGENQKWSQEFKENEKQKEQIKNQLGNIQKQKQFLGLNQLIFKYGYNYNVGQNKKINKQISNKKKIRKNRQIRNSYWRKTELLIL